MVELLVLLAFASHRLSLLWLTQRVFGPARAGLGWLHPRIQYFVNCPVCVGTWGSLALYAMWNVSWLGQGIVWMLAISSLAAFLNSIAEVATAYIQRG